MSEKRFTTDYSDFLQNDKTFIKRGNERLTYKEIVDLLNEQQATISQLEEENDKLIQKNCIPCELVNLQTREIDKLKEENEKLRMKLKGDDYIMVSEMLSNLRKTGICDGCKNKDKPVEWYLERGFSITGRVCDRYEPE